MDFNDLLNEVKGQFNSWLTDEVIISYYNGDIEDIQKEFLECIQVAIGSSLVIRTKEYDLNKMLDFYKSMEGLE